MDGGPTMRVHVGDAQLLLRPLAPDDAPELLRIHRAPEVVRWWGAPEEGFPFTDEPEQTRLSIFYDGRVAGLMQYWEGTDPRYRHATIDVFLDPRLHGRGIGTRALRLLVDYLLGGRGHHRLTIDPAAENVAAIRCYEKVGFTRVGVMRRYERRADGSFADGLLMELVSDEKVNIPRS